MMNPRSLGAAAVLILLAAPPARTETIDLAGAIARGRAQAREVAAATERARAGSQRLRQAKAFRLPRVSLQEVWMRTDSPAEAFALQLNQERFSLPAFAAGNPNDPEDTENALTRLELSLPLYTGGEISGRIRQAALAAEASENSAVRTEEEAALAAAEAYIRLAQVREQVGLLEASLNTVRAHVRLAQAFVDQGMLVRSELLRAEVEMARIEDFLSQARGQSKVAEANLSFRLARDLSTTWELTPLPDPPPLQEDLADWLAGAANRGDLAAAENLLGAGELEVSIQRSGLRPKIGLVARRDFNDENPFGASGDSTAILAMASVDLFGGGRHRAAAAAAGAELDAARIEVEQFREGIRLAIKNAYQRASSTRERHRTSVAALGSAREAERITQERFEKGVVKTIDLLDAVNARREAETRELVARAEAHLAGLALSVEAGRQPESALPSAPGPAPSSVTTQQMNAKEEI